MSIENTNDIVINNTVINNTVINNKGDDLDLEKESEIRIYNTWDELDLNPDLLRSIYGHGFEKPSPIQSKGIAPIKEGRDIIAQAQSGTGKTGSRAHPWNHPAATGIETRTRCSERFDRPARERAKPAALVEAETHRAGTGARRQQTSE